MAAREYSRDWLTTLPQESARWVSEGVITAEQRAALLALYPATPQGQDRTVLVISILGSLLLGLGVILFFAANWPAIPAAVKLATLILATGGAYAAGYQLQFVRGTYPRIGQSLIFLGSLLYGAGIWLIAQTYHLDSHFPDGFLAWGVGLLPLVWATGSRPVLYLATVLLAIWTGTEQLNYHTYNLLLPVLVLGALVPLARRLEARLAEAGGLLALGFWLVSLVAVRGGVDRPDFPFLEAFTLLLLLYGLALVAVGLARFGSQRVYVGVGALAVMLSAYLLTFRFESQDLAPLDALLRHPDLLVAGAVCLLVGLAGAVGYGRLRAPGRAPVLGMLAVALVAGIGFTTAAPVVRMVGFNLLLVAEAIGLVVFGIQQRLEVLVNLGLLAFVVQAFTRYVDLFFGAMDKSIFFIGCGVLLLGGGWLVERNRRRWLSEMGGGE